MNEKEINDLLIVIWQAIKRTYYDSLLSNNSFATTHTHTHTRTVKLTESRQEFRRSDLNTALQRSEPPPSDQRQRRRNLPIPSITRTGHDLFFQQPEQRTRIRKCRKLDVPKSSEVELQKIIRDFGDFRELRFLKTSKLLKEIAIF